MLSWLNKGWQILRTAMSALLLSVLNSFEHISRNDNIEGNLRSSRFSPTAENESESEGFYAFLKKPLGLIRYLFHADGIGSDDLVTSGDSASVSSSRLKKNVFKDNLPESPLNKKLDEFALCSEIMDPAYYQNIPDLKGNVLSFLELALLTTAKTKSKALERLKNNLDEAQEKIDEIEDILQDASGFQRGDMRKDYILELGEYVEEIFKSVEDLGVHLVKCHAKEMRATVKNTKKGVKSIENRHNRLNSKLGVKDGISSKKLSDSPVVWMIPVFVYFFLLSVMANDPLAMSYTMSFLRNLTRF